MVHQKARELAASRRQSLSSVVAELAAHGLAQLDLPVVVHTDGVSGFPVISVGAEVTAVTVAAALDEE